MTDTVTLIALKEFEKTIKGHLDLEDDNIVFNYRDNDTGIGMYLDLITINPIHKQSFLFHTTLSRDKIAAVQEMLYYITTHRPKENSYTIQWKNKEDRDLQTSYFMAPTIIKVLEKFYHGRDEQSTIVFNVALNPIA